MTTAVITAVIASIFLIKFYTYNSFNEKITNFVLKNEIVFISFVFNYFFNLCIA